MKKIIAIVLTLLMLCSFSVVASAAPAALDGFEVTILVESLQYINDAGFYPATSGDDPFWVQPNADMARPITLENGKLTFLQQECWGALLSMNPDLQEMSLNKTGWGFSIENGDAETTITVGFNEAATNQTYVIDENSIYMLVSEDGEITVDYAVWTSSSQGGAIIPANFKGHIYIPFDQYYHSTDYTAYDPSTMKLFTPIYALSGGAEFTFCEYFVYESDVNLEDLAGGETSDPTDTPTEPEVTEPTQTEEVTEPTQTEEVTEPTQTEEVTEPTQTEEVTEPTQTEEVTEPIQTEEATPAPSVEASATSSENPTEPKDEAGFPWIIVAVAAVVVIAGVVVAVVLISKKKKA